MVSVTLLEYLDEPSIVVIVELRLIKKLKLLFNRTAKKDMLLRYKKLVSDTIPVGIKTDVILSL